MSAGMCLMKSVWSLSVRCDEKHGNCDQNGVCICEVGYRNDLSFYRYRDCKVPALYLLTTDVVLLLLFFLSLLFAVYNFKTSKSLARIVIKSVICGNLFAILIMIIRLVQHDYLSSYSLVAFLFSANCWSLGGYMSAFSLASPLCKLSRVSEHKIKKGLKISYLFFRIINLLPILVSFQYSDVNDIANDDPWNKCLAATYLIHSFELLVIGYGIVIVGNTMVSTIKKLSTESGRIDSRSHSRMNYVNKVKKYFTFFAVFTPVMSAVFCLQPILHLATGYIPYCFIIFTVTLFNLFLFSIFQTTFAISKRADISDTPNNKHLSTQRVVSSSTNVISPIALQSIKETQ